MILLGHSGGWDGRVGQAHALLVGDAPRDFDDGQSRGLGSAAATRNNHFAVVDEDSVPLRERTQNFWMRQARRALGIAGRGVAIKDEGLAACAVRQPSPRKARPGASGPCRSTRIPIGRPASSSIARIIATRSRIPSWEAWLMLMRNTSAPATNRALIVSLSADAGPSVAMILMRRLRRACKGVLRYWAASGPRRCF